MRSLTQAVILSAESLVSDSKSKDLIRVKEVLFLQEIPRIKCGFRFFRVFWGVWTIIEKSAFLFTAQTFPTIQRECYHELSDSGYRVS